MKSIVKGVHLDLTRGLKEHVQAHLIEPIEHFFDDEAAEMEVHLRDINGPKGGRDMECSITFRMPGIAAIHVTEVTEDMYKSIDVGRDRLERLVKRELEKRREPNGHNIKNPASRPVSAAYAGTSLEDILEDSSGRGAETTLKS